MRPVAAVGDLDFASVIQGSDALLLCAVHVPAVENMENARNKIVPEED